MTGLLLLLNAGKRRAEDVPDRHDVLEKSAGTAGYQCLIGIEASIMYMLHDPEWSPV